MGTRTYAFVDVSPATFAEIYSALEAADYGHGHAFVDDGSTIDMHGLALRANPEFHRSAEEATAWQNGVMAAGNLFLLACKTLPDAECEVLADRCRKISAALLAEPEVQS